MESQDNRLADAGRINGTCDTAADAVGGAHIWCEVSLRHTGTTPTLEEVRVQLLIAKTAMRQALALSAQAVEELLYPQG